jgi:Txe/YoeB family toxin of toxin-antitoxin system
MLFIGTGEGAALSRDECGFSRLYGVGRMAYEIRFSKTARRDVQQLTPKLKKKLREILLEHVARDPHSGKKLVGDLTGLYSVRLTFKDRIVYAIDEKHRIIYILRARTHYGE